MSVVESLVGSITKLSRPVIAVMLVLTLVLGAGLPLLEEESSLDQFETDSPEAEAFEDAQDRFGTAENETAAQIVVHDDNVLSKASLLETLELQQQLREDETVNETLPADEAFSDLSGIVATVAVQQERAAELEARADALEADRAALEARSATAVELINETREIQEAYAENELQFELGQIDEESYDEERTRLEGEFDAVHERARDEFTDEEYDAFAALVERTRDVQGELFRVGVEYEFGLIDDDEFADRTGELGADLEEIYEDVENEVFAETIADLERRGEALEADAEAIPEIELTLAESIEQLEGMDQDEIDDVLEEVLGEDAHREAFVFVPEEFEPGTTETDARMLFVTQTADEPLATVGETTDEIVDAQLGMAEAVDDRFGEDGFVFGTGVLTDEIDRSLFDSLGIVLPLALLFVAVVLTIAYRDLPDILLGLAGIATVLVWTFGFMGWAGIAFNQVMIAVPVLIVGLSIDYSIHVFMRHREQRDRAGTDSERVPRGAMGIVLFGLGVAFIWVTTTAAIGFLSNLVSPVEPIQEFGIASAFGIVSALAIFGVLVPAAKIELDELLEARGIDRRKPAFGTGGGRFTGLLSLGQRTADRGPWLAVVLVLLLTTGAAAGAVQLDTTFDEEEFVAEDPPAWMGALPEPFAVGEYETSANLAFVTDRFVRLDVRTHVVVDGAVTRDDTLERVDEAETLAADQGTTVVLPNDEPHVTSPLSEMDAVAAENETFNETRTDADTTGDGVPDTDLEAVYDAFFAADPDRAAGVLERTDDGEYEGLQLLVSVDGDADAVTDDGRDLAAVLSDDHREATATGQPIVFGVVEDDLFEAVFESLLVSLVAVFLVLMVAYRWRYGSAALGAITLSPIVLSVAWILGTMYLLSIPFNVMTGTITSLTIGLGVAYNIHMTERFMLERARGADVQDALSRSVTGTGGALFGSAATTVGGFGMLVFAILPPLQQFGLITALTIAYAFVGSVFVLPSLLVLWTRHLAVARGRRERTVTGARAVDDED